MQIVNIENAELTCSKISGFNSNVFTCDATTDSITVYGFNQGEFSAGFLSF